MLESSQINWKIMTNAEHIEDTSLNHLIIRVKKADSAFVYFQLEANEGICFYSTLTSSLGTGYRDIDIKGHITLKEELAAILNSLKIETPFVLLSGEL